MVQAIEAERSFLSAGSSAEEWRLESARTTAMYNQFDHWAVEAPMGGAQLTREEAQQVRAMGGEDVRPSLISSFSKPTPQLPLSLSLHPLPFHSISFRLSLKLNSLLSTPSPFPSPSPASSHTSSPSPSPSHSPPLISLSLSLTLNLPRRWRSFPIVTVLLTSRGYQSYWSRQLGPPLSTSLSQLHAFVPAHLSWSSCPHL